MYFAKFETESEEFVQGIASIRIKKWSIITVASNPWEEIARGLSRAAQIFRSSIACRFTVDERQHFQSLILVTVPVSYENRLREIFAQLTRIERMPEVSISYAQNREERDEWAGDIGKFQLCPSMGSFSVKGSKLAYNFRVSPFLNDLFVDACLGKYKLTYQINIRFLENHQESVRLARKNALALSGLSGATKNLIEWQEELSRNLGYSSGICEEYLAVDSQDYGVAISSIVADQFHKQFGSYGFSYPDFRFKDNSYKETLSLGIHSHDIEPLDPIDLCGAALFSKERDQLLAWQPSPHLIELFAAENKSQIVEISYKESQESNNLDLLELPNSYLGENPFAFVSYKRQDLKRIAPIINQLWSNGIYFWYDRNIPGGSEWDEIIEEKISKSRIILLFVSQEAINSKYVRREVKFADALDIPVLPILLEDVKLSHGMNMLLTQYQIIDTRNINFSNKLFQALNLLKVVN